MRLKHSRVQLLQWRWCCGAVCACLSFQREGVLFTSMPLWGCSREESLYSLRSLCQPCKQPSVSAVECDLSVLFLVKMQWQELAHSCFLENCKVINHSTTGYKRDGHSTLARFLLYPVLEVLQKKTEQLFSVLHCSLKRQHALCYKGNLDFPTYRFISMSVCQRWNKVWVLQTNNQNMTVTNSLRDLIHQHTTRDLWFTDDGRCELGLGRKEEPRRGRRLICKTFGRCDAFLIECNVTGHSPNKSKTWEEIRTDKFYILFYFSPRFSSFVFPTFSLILNIMLGLCCHP